MISYADSAKKWRIVYTIQSRYTISNRRYWWNLFSDPNIELQFLQYFPTLSAQYLSSSEKFLEEFSSVISSLASITSSISDPLSIY
jgi:hypothetical protein